jgi:hypothetical protein
MKKFIKFIMSRGESITLPQELAEKLIENESQLLLIPNEQGQWSGKLINKAHIVSTDHDTDMEIAVNLKNRHKIELNRPKPTPEQIEKVNKIKAKIRKKFKIKK